MPRGQSISCNQNQGNSFDIWGWYFILRQYLILQQKRVTSMIIQSLFGSWSILKAAYGLCFWCTFQSLLPKWFMVGSFLQNSLQNPLLLLLKDRFGSKYQSTRPMSSCCHQVASELLDADSEESLGRKNPQFPFCCHTTEWIEFPIFSEALSRIDWVFLQNLMNTQINKPLQCSREPNLLLQDATGKPDSVMPCKPPA